MKTISTLYQTTCRRTVLHFLKANYRYLNYATVLQDPDYSGYCWKSLNKNTVLFQLNTLLSFSTCFVIKFLTALSLCVYMYAYICSNIDINFDNSPSRRRTLKKYKQSKFINKSSLYNTITHNWAQDKTKQYAINYKIFVKISENNWHKPKHLERRFSLHLHHRRSKNDLCPRRSQHKEEN